MLSTVKNMASRVLGTGTSHDNSESSRTSTAKAGSTSYLPWSGPALHGGVLSHGYLEVGQIPPWPVKQSPVYHLAAIGRYGVNTPISGSIHLQPSIGYEPYSWKALGIDNDERPTLSPEIREILRKYSPKTQGMFRKHLPVSEASTAAGHHGTVALDPSDIPISEGQSTFSSSNAIARHESFLPHNKAASRKRGHRYDCETAQKLEGSRDPQYVQVFPRELGESTWPHEKFELPYVGYKRRFRDTDTGSIQQDRERGSVTPTRQIAIAKSRLPPKGQKCQRSPIVIPTSPSTCEPIARSTEVLISRRSPKVQIPPPRKRRNIALLSSDRIDSDTYVPTPLRSSTGELRIKGLAKVVTPEMPSSPPVNKVSNVVDEKPKETMPRNAGYGRILRPRNTKNDVQPTPARSGTGRYALRNRRSAQKQSAPSPKLNSPKSKKQKTTRGGKS